MAYVCVCVYDIFGQSKVFSIMWLWTPQQRLVELYENSVYVVKHMNIMGNINNAYYLWWS